MPFEPGSLTVSRVDANTWSLVDDLVYQGNRERFVVPAGFRTDFATVPRVVTWLIPRFGAYTLAAILHDWLVSEGIGSGVVSAREADGLFRRVMRESGVPVMSGLSRCAPHVSSTAAGSVSSRSARCGRTRSIRCRR